MALPHKPAPTDLPLLYGIKERWSPRAISGKLIPQEKVDVLFESARWAPSSFNEQPWAYIYATRDSNMRGAREKLESLLAPGNSWAKEAFLLLLSVAKDTFERTGKANRHAAYDTGAATENLFLSLQPLGLMGHQMAGFDHLSAPRVLGIPAGYTPMAMMAIGYPGDRRKLPPELLKWEEAPRERKLRSAFVFRGSWGVSA